MLEERKKMIMNLKNTIVDLKRRKWSLQNLDEVNAKRKLQSSGEVYKGETACSYLLSENLEAVYRLTRKVIVLRLNLSL